MPTPMSLACRVARQQPVREEAGPVLKWAGGKSRLLEQLLPLLPERVDRYFEPFFGGGAMFFRLQPGRALLSDLNEELVNVYACVRDRVEELIAHLGRHRYEPNYYYRQRALDPASLPALERASRTIYLNRTCFNGLYRVNRRGQFNVPIGRYDNPTICHPDRLRAVSGVLRGVDIWAADYQDALEEAQAGDFVYFDPPYQPLTRTANFTSYTATDFGEADQRALAASAAALDRRGVRWMLSNSDTPLVRELYAPFRLDTVVAPRAISRSPAGRAGVTEVVARNY